MVSVLGLYYGSLGLIGLALSLISLTIIYRQTSLCKSPLGLCLANLASNQLGLVCFGYLTFGVPSHFAGHWIWGDRSCYLFGTLKQYFQSVIYHGLFLLALEHYLRLKTGPKKYYSHGFFFSLTIWTWVSVGTWSVLPFLGWGNYVKKEYTCDISMQLTGASWIHASYPLCLAFFTFILPTGFTFHFLGAVANERKRRKRSLVLDLSSGAVTKVTLTLAIFAFSVYFLLEIIGFMDWILVSSPNGFTHLIFPLETVHSVLAHLIILISPFWYFLGSSFSELETACMRPEPSQPQRKEKVESESDNDRLPPLLRNLPNDDEETIHVLDSHSTPYA